jgi:hypothetical protein
VLDITVLAIEICEHPAGLRPVVVKPTAFGFARNVSSAEALMSFTQELVVNGIAPSEGSIAGGTEITLYGSGFSDQINHNNVTFGLTNQDCVITSSSYKSLTCRTPEAMKTASSAIGVRVADDSDGLYELVGQAKRCTGTRDLYSDTMSLAECAAKCLERFWTDECRAFNVGYGFGLGKCELILGHDYCLFPESAGSFFTDAYRLKDADSFGYHEFYYFPIWHSSTNCTSNEYWCNFNFNKAPRVTGFTPTSGLVGQELTITGYEFGPYTGEVVLGESIDPKENVPCTVSVWSRTMVVCSLGEIPAGYYKVRVLVVGVGYALPHSTDFQALLDLARIETVWGRVRLSQDAVPNGVTWGIGYDAALPTYDVGGINPLQGGYGGGVDIILRGSGFGLNPSQSVMEVGGINCTVQNSTYYNLTCRTAEYYSSAVFARHPRESDGDIRVDGDAVISGRSGYGRQSTNAVDYWTLFRMFDGDVDYPAQLSGDNCNIGISLSSERMAILTEIKYYPPVQDDDRKVFVTSIMSEMARFQYKNRSQSDWKTVILIDEKPRAGWNTFTIDTPVYAQEFRYYGSHRRRRRRQSGPECNLHQLQFRGHVLVNQEASAVGDTEVGLKLAMRHPQATYASLTADPSAVKDSSDQAAKFVHKIDLTPTVTLLGPSNGTARGGTEVTIAGTKLGIKASATEVTLNNYACSVQSVNETSLTCLTGPRNNGIFLEKTIVRIAGSGFAFCDEDATFRYLDKWSDVRTWRDEEPPVDGDTVIVPEGQAVLLDISTPKLFLVLVQGLFVFDNKHLTMNATYIWVHGGAFEIGRPDQPFMYNATITMHGDKWTTVELPHVGAKGLTVSNAGGLVGDSARPRKVGRLDLHGEPRIPKAKLNQTALAGQKYLDLAWAVDWRPGEIIVLHTPLEELVVANISDDRTRVFLTTPLRAEHEGTFYTYGGYVADIRSVVALRSRNVVIQGDEASDYQFFGAHTGAFFGGIYRVEFTELRRCGQSGLLGRYCTHFHVMSPGRNVDVYQSYVTNNVMRESFQRATTVHKTDHTIVNDNFALNVRGHAFFIEDGKEKSGTMDRNFVIRNLPMTLGLPDDLKPAGLWAPTGLLFWRDNVVADSPFGYRFNPKGSGADSLVGEFLNNTSIGCGQGVQVFPAWGGGVKRFYNTTAFKCGSAQFVKVCNGCKFINEMWIESGGGMSHKMTSPGYSDEAQYQNVLCVGTRDPQKVSSLRVGTQFFFSAFEYWQVEGAIFVNYGSNNVIRGGFAMPGLTGGFMPVTVRFKGLVFDNTTQRLMTNYPSNKVIYLDLDGSLTGQSNAWATGYFGYNSHPACTALGSTTTKDYRHHCNSSVNVRAVYVDESYPNQLDQQKLTIRSLYGYDEIKFEAMENYGWSLPLVVAQDHSRYKAPAWLGGTTPWSYQQLSFSKAWYYKALEYWYTFRIDDSNDIQRLEVEFSTSTWLSEAEWFGAHFPFEHNYVSWNDAWISGQTSNKAPAQRHFPGPADGFGAHAVLLELCSDSNDCTANGTLIGYTNETNTPDYKDVMSNGTHSMVFTGAISSTPSVRWQAKECPTYGCPEPPPPVLGPSNLWSKASAWPSGKVPKELDDVEITETMHLIFDVDTPVLGKVVIYGMLEWANFSYCNTSCKLTARSIEVYGTLQIGTEDNRFLGQATIALWGDTNLPPVVMTEGLFLMHKVMGVLGNLTLHGKNYTEAWTRLASTASKGATAITVQGVLDWPPGAEIAIAPTEYYASNAPGQSETRTMLSITTNVGLGTSTLTLNTPLTFRHFAGTVEGVELRAAVGLLDRNIRFTTHEALSGTMSDADLSTIHGAHMVLGGSQDGKYVANASLSWVEFKYAGKYDFRFPALRRHIQQGSHIGTKLDAVSFTHSAFSGFELVGSTSSVNVSRCIFHGLRGTALWGDYSATKLRLDDNLVTSMQRHPRAGGEWYIPTATFQLDTVPVSMTGNVAAGGYDIGFQFRPPKCTGNDASNVFGTTDAKANEAYGNLVGFFILRACRTAGGSCSSTTCAKFMNARSWKNSHAGVIFVDMPVSLTLQYLHLADNHIGVTGHFHRGMGDMDLEFELLNSSVLGTTAASTCDYSIGCHTMDGSPKEAMDGSMCKSVVGTDFRRVGVMMPIITNRGKTCEDGPNLPDSGCEVARNTPDRDCVMPWEQRYGIRGSRYAQYSIKHLKVGYFSSTDCGRRSVALTYNPTGRDWNPPVDMSGITWVNQSDSKGKFFFDFWAGNGDDSDCAPGGKGCDGIMQMWLRDADGTLGAGAAGGAIVNKNPGLALPAPGCNAAVEFDAYACPEIRLRLVNWESADHDCCGWDRRELGPFKVERKSDGRAFWSAHMFDDVACPRGCEFGNSFYPAAVHVGQSYDFTIPATMPKKSRLHFFSEDESEWVILNIYFNQPLQIRIYRDGVKAGELLSRDEIPTSSDAHGAHAQDPQAKRFHILLKGRAGGYTGTGGLFLQTIEVVQVSMSLAVPVSEFDSNNFIGNLATLLGIDPTRIKVVDVRVARRLSGAEDSALLPSFAVDVRRLQSGTAVDVEIAEDPPAPDSSDFGSTAVESTASSSSTFTGAPPPSPPGSPAPPPSPPPAVFSGVVALQSLANTITTQAAAGSLNVGYTVSSVAVTSVPSVPEPAVQRIQCTLKADGELDCICDPGWYGSKCQYECGCHGPGSLNCTDGQNGDGSCICAANWFGTTCGDQCNCTSVNAVGCNDGSAGDGSCICKNSNWGGYHCNVCAEHYYTPETDCTTYCNPAVQCNGHGTCELDAAGVPTGSCTCETGWRSPTCDQCLPNYFPPSTCANFCTNTTCSGHGECSSQGSCHCEIGWGGADCAQCATNYYPAGTCDTFCSVASTCGGSGECTEAGQCVCFQGFSGLSCGISEIAPTYQIFTTSKPKTPSATQASSSTMTTTSGAISSDVSTTSLSQQSTTPSDCGGPQQPECTEAIKSRALLGGLDPAVVGELSVWAQTAVPAFKSSVAQFMQASGASVAADDIFIESMAWYSRLRRLQEDLEFVRTQGKLYLGRQLAMIAVAVDFLVVVNQGSSSQIQNSLQSASQDSTQLVDILQSEITKRCTDPSSCAVPTGIVVSEPEVVAVAPPGSEIESDGPTTTYPPGVYYPHRRRRRSEIFTFETTTQPTTSSSSTSSSSTIPIVVEQVDEAIGLLPRAPTPPGQDEDDDSPGEVATSMSVLPFVAAILLCNAAAMCWWCRSSKQSMYAVQVAPDRNSQVELDPVIEIGSLLARLELRAVVQPIGRKEGRGNAEFPNQDTALARFKPVLTAAVAVSLPPLFQEDVRVSHVSLNPATGAFVVVLHLVFPTLDAASAAKRIAERWVAGERDTPARVLELALNKGFLALESMTSIVVRYASEGVETGEALPDPEKEMETFDLDIQLAQVEYVETPPWVKLDDGSQFQGHIAGEGTASTKEGFGKFIKADGTQYTGCFAQDFYDGAGVLVSQEKGVKYSGQWSQGKMEGHGLLCKSEEISEDWKYNGQFRDNRRHGLGRCEWSDGRWYEGEWKLGQPDGVGAGVGRGAGAEDIRVKRMEGGEQCEDMGPLRVELDPDVDPQLQNLTRVILYEAQEAVDDGLPVLEEEVPIFRWGFSVARPGNWTASQWGALMVTRVHSTGPVHGWNNAFPNNAVRANALIWSVNDCSDPDEMLKVLVSESDYLKLDVRNGDAALRLALPPSRRGSKQPIRVSASSSSLPGSVPAPPPLPPVPPPAEESPVRAIPEPPAAPEDPFEALPPVGRPSSSQGYPAPVESSLPSSIPEPLPPLPPPVQANRPSSAVVRRLSADSQAASAAAEAAAFKARAAQEAVARAKAEAEAARKAAEEKAAQALAAEEIALFEAEEAAAKAKADEEAAARLHITVAQVLPVPPTLEQQRAVPPPKSGYAPEPPAARDLSPEHPSRAFEVPSSSQDEMTRTPSKLFTEKAFEIKHGLDAWALINSLLKEMQEQDEQVEQKPLELDVIAQRQAQLAALDQYLADRRSLWDTLSEDERSEVERQEAAIARVKQGLQTQMA